jgi:hypothetical protein
MNQISLRNDCGLPSEHEMAVFTTMSKQAVASKMYRGIGDEAGVMMIMLSAREFGIPAMQALNGGINIINGKVELSARMIGALIRRAGHEIDVKESTETRCTLIGKRRQGGSSLEVSYTLAEAQKSGLVKPGGGWTKNPLDMCFARAISRLSRQLFPDVIGIGYVQGEISNPSGTPEIEEIDEETVLKEEIVIEDDEVHSLRKYLDIFSSEEDRKLGLEYLETLMDHYKLPKLQMLHLVLRKGPHIFLEAFNRWKSKEKTKEIA